MNHINATILSVDEEQVFNQIDSTKTIVLSTSDTIVISKKFGILRFDPVYEADGYKLAGIENVIGDKIPGIFDYYNFSVGDVFEFEGGFQEHVDLSNFSFRKKISIISKTTLSDSIVYDVHQNYFEEEYTIPTLPYPYEKGKMKTQSDFQWTFIKNSNNPSNRYQGELIPYSDIFQDDIDSQQPFDFTLLHYEIDDRNYISKSTGSMEGLDLLIISDSQDDMLFRSNQNGLLGFEMKYEAGLGKVYDYRQGFEWYFIEELVAYAKDGDTVGILTDDSFFSDLYESKMNSVSLYPNPASDFIYVSEGFTVDEISILGLNGSVLKTFFHTNQISLEGLEPSIYLIRVVSANKVYWKKILKK